VKDRAATDLRAAGRTERKCEPSAVHTTLRKCSIVPWMRQKLCKNFIALREIPMTCCSTVVRIRAKKYQLHIVLPGGSVTVAVKSLKADMPEWTFVSIYAT
jgi:hypothetical protein